MNAPIGVFDSGMGGLTVLRALRDRLPGEHFIYLGDTARLPYGTKSAATVQKYALKASAYLVELGVKALVVACNTASATALPALQAAFSSIPVIGVVEPGADAATAQSGGGVVVFATESTVRGGAYQRALLARGARRVWARPCPLLVTLAEEGWVDDDITRGVLRRYLNGWFSTDGADTLLLGCTHFPVFRSQLDALLPAHVKVVDSATTTATALAALLTAQGLQTRDSAPGALTLCATDGSARFIRVGEQFLGMRPDSVELVDL